MGIPEIEFQKMNNSKSGNNILIILGMHRSGTSLTANWLDKCGLELGNQFIDTDVGNVTGYYEDKDFVNFHRKLMAKNGFNTPFYSQTKNLEYDEADLLEAKNLVGTRNSKFSQWSWKDPRTCLFLGLWHEVLPKAKVIVLLRHYDEVVDSLIRRKIKTEKNRKNFISGMYNSITKNKYRKQSFTNGLLQSWITHNLAIYNYLKLKSKEDYRLIESTKIYKHHEKLFVSLKNSFGFQLNLAPIDSVYKKSLLNKGIKNIDFDKDLTNTASKLYDTMQAYSISNSHINGSFSILK